MRPIRVALAGRDSSFRAWVRQWAHRAGHPPEAAYQTARSTMSRRLAYGLPPRPGSVGEAIVNALREDLGVAVVPYPASDPRAANEDVGY